MLSQFLHMSYHRTHVFMLVLVQDFDSVHILTSSRYQRMSQQVYLLNYEAQNIHTQNKQRSLFVAFACFCTHALVSQRAVVVLFSTKKDRMLHEHCPARGDRATVLAFSRLSAFKRLFVSVFTFSLTLLLYHDSPASSSRNSISCRFSTLQVYYLSRQIAKKIVKVCSSLPQLAVWTYLAS